MTKTAHNFTFRTIGGGSLCLEDLKGRPILIVNTASECGFTPQYRELQQLWEEYEPKGLMVLGVPSNDFGGQEPGSESDIASFCERNYGVTFPMTAKQTVLGANAHPFYRWIVEQAGEGAAPRWNFHKYLVGPEGELLDMWPSKTKPGSPEIRSAIDNALTNQ